MQEMDVERKEACCVFSERFPSFRLRRHEHPHFLSTSAMSSLPPHLS
jgi:hypothetical protein